MTISFQTARTEAMIWWNDALPSVKKYFTNKHYFGRNPSSLTGREIQLMKEKEELEFAAHEKLVEWIKVRFNDSLFLSHNLNPDPCTNSYEIQKNDEAEVFLDDDEAIKHLLQEMEKDQDSFGVLFTFLNTYSPNELENMILYLATDTQKEIINNFLI